jgi:methylated-DNA-protein-cysteine methyltransferase-like protein
MVKNDFRNKIYDLIAQVPKGKVTTYGDLAALAGHANAPRIVGGIAHFGLEDLPWHRLVNRFGGLASGFHGGRDVQEQLLKSEGVSCTNYIVDNFKDIRWKSNIQRYH